MQEKKKDKYLHPCQEHRKDFTPLVYSVGGIRGREVRITERRLVAELAEKWSQPYSHIVHYVKVRMSIVVACANSLLSRASHNRGHTHHCITSGPVLLILQESQVE